MIHILQVFLVSFTSVFLLGFQSRAVNHDNYWMAAGNSLLIGVVQWQVWALADHERTFLVSLVFAAGGSAGIVSSMVVHKKLLQRWRKPKQ